MTWLLQVLQVSVDELGVILNQLQRRLKAAEVELEDYKAELHKKYFTCLKLERRFTRNQLPACKEQWDTAVVRCQSRAFICSHEPTLLDHVHLSFDQG